MAILRRIPYILPFRDQILQRTYGGSELRAKNVDSCHLGLPNVVCMFMELKILRDYNENILAKIHKSGS